MFKSLFLIFGIGASSVALCADIVAHKTAVNLNTIEVDDKAWLGATAESLDLTAQPLYPPRPNKTLTEKIKVQALYNKEKLSMRLSWSDSEKSDGGKPGEQSDAVAIQFPVRISGDAPPLVFMGSKDDPVHIFHWRAQYQHDAEHGKPTVKKLYPNMSVDIYPLEFPDHGNLKKISDTEREKYSPAVAVGNAQSFAKTGVDEIIAEGFGTSSVKKPSSIQSISKAQWKNGAWTVVITRPLACDEASIIQTKTGSHVAFAVWQGGKSEVGSRKSVSMMWTPIVFKDEEGAAQ